MDNVVREPREVGEASRPVVGLGAERQGEGLAGEVVFASPEAQVQRTAELMGSGAIVVAIPPLPRALAGRLAEHVDEHVERALAASGCPSPFLTSWSAMPDDAEARLSDQLFRARTVGATGIALAMGSLSGGASILGPHDSATLARLARIAAQAPLVVMLDDADAELAGYGPPVPLASLLLAPRTMHAQARAEPHVEEHVEEHAEEHAEEHVEEHAQAHVDAREDGATESHVDTQVDTIVAPIELEPATRRDEPASVEPVKEDARRRATVGVPVSGPNDFWRSWALALGAAKGPQPLAAFERLFVESYVPLANAVADGLDDPRAIRAYDEFRRAFERAYTDSFQTFGATNRRPRLVMDAFDLAAKQARLHNARAAHVLVVDSMRYDVGAIVRDTLAARSVASLTAETTLFAALPTTTTRQLETLARGIDALRAPSTDEPSESLRGRSADLVRRLRVGSRELYKLDVIPARIGIVEERLGAGESLAGGLEAVADHVVDALVRHLATLTPRTLLLLIGDHGFSIDRRGHVTCGGAAPEEVIVPALAYLVGDLH